MKTLFIASATISGVISFCATRSILARNQKVYEDKMAVMDAWFNRPK